MKKKQKYVRSKKWLKSQTTKERTKKFWSLVNKTNKCWLWQGSMTEHGYGLFKRFYGETRSHRIAWTMTNVKIKAGLNALHECDNPPYVRPHKEHVQLGTQKKNVSDCVARGRFRYILPPDASKCRGEKHHWTKWSDADILYIQEHYTSGRPYHAGNVKQLSAMFTMPVNTVRYMALGNGRAGEAQRRAKESKTMCDNQAELVGRIQTIKDHANETSYEKPYHFCKKHLVTAKGWHRQYYSIGRATPNTKCQAPEESLLYTEEFI